jgi:putative flippase GtrA
MKSSLKNFFSNFYLKGGIFMFLRAQLSSQAATWIDNGIAFGLKKTLDIFKIKSITFFSHGIESYVFAIVIGQILGGLTSCILNYKFTFKPQNLKFRYILLKFFLVWLGSLFLNTYFTFLITEWLKGQPLILKVLGENNPDDVFIIVKLSIALLVGFFWNYTMYHRFVYKDRKINEFFKKFLHIKKV